MSMRSALEWIGGFTVVLAVYASYRYLTDPLFTDEYAKGFVSGIVLFILIGLMREIRKEFK